jgi:hypothetical protein
MKKNRTVLTLFVLMTILSLFSAGCGLKARKRAADTEVMLLEAGFERMPADTPDKMAQLKKMAQKKVTPQKRNGEVIYVYPDAKHCKCLYIGSQRAYDRFQGILLKRQIDGERLRETSGGKSSSMEWGIWEFRDIYTGKDPLR